ncbi:MAG: VWA domain-containing protein [Phycisphaerae bacterium]|nr:VWA domain-containing protein [Phycisphaerae bacterium]
MAMVEVRCGKCGKVVQFDDAKQSSQICSNCQNQVVAPAARARPQPQVQVAGAARPPAMPQVRVNGAAAPVAAVTSAPIIEDEEEQSSLQAAFAWLLPWALSITFHLAAFLLLMFLTFQISSGGDSLDEEDAGKETDITIPTHKLGDSDNPGSTVLTNFAGIEAYGPGKDKTDFSKPAADLQDGAKGGGSESEFASIGIITPGASGNAAGSGDGTGMGTAGKGAVFGSCNAGGRGSKCFGSGLPKRGVMKVVYVVDKSGSMLRTFDFVKAELVRSVGELAAKQQFHVVMFADGRPMELQIGGQCKLQYATADNKNALKEWVKGISPASDSGATDPRQGLERAFKLSNGPPQLVYMLTDGLFPRETLEMLKKINAEKKVHINTIAFGNDARVAEDLMKKIAEENGGVYKWISDDELGKDY